jgi:putative SOS response-associated peptidase YedK
VGSFVKRRYMLSPMCGRSTYKLTWEEIVALYRLTLDQPALNTRARFNVCPTTTIDTIVELAESDSSFRCVVRDYFGLMVISTAASGPRWSRSEA